jgi:hypothetical protein
VEKLHAVTRVHWLTALDDATFSHIWWGAWSFLGLRSWMYHVVRFAAAAAAIGLLWLLATMIQRIWRRRILGLFSARVALLALSYALFTAGMAYYSSVLFALTSQSTALGWYWYAMAATEVTLLTLGTRVAMRSNRASIAAMVFVIAAFVAMDLYATHWLLIPYYSGLIRFRPNGSLEAWRFTGAFSWSDTLARLSTNKVGFIRPAIPVLWTLYVFATAGLLGLAIRVMLYARKSTINRQTYSTSSTESAE